MWELITQDTTALELVKLNTIANPCLQHLRQVRAACAALIAHVVRELFGQSAVISVSQSTTLAIAG